MPIDWSATGAMLTGWGTLAGAGAVAFAASKAANTFDSWRRQKVEGRRFEHAERTLSATYKVADAIDLIRGQIIHGFELASAEKELEEEPDFKIKPPSHRARLITGQALIRRIRQTEKAWDELEDSRPLAKALFGNELESALGKLHRIRWIMRINIDTYADGFGDNKELALKVRKQMHNSVEGDDEVSQAVAAAIDVVEKTCLPVLRA